MNILFYLLRRIITLNLVSKRITYKTIYHDLGYDNATSINKLHLREKVKKILDAWKGLTFGKDKNDTLDPEVEDLLGSEKMAVIEI